jgi:hypothetical protein
MSEHVARLIADPKTPTRFLAICVCGWMSPSDLSLREAETARADHEGFAFTDELADRPEPD